MISSTYELWSFMQGLKKISTRERSSAELRFASSLAPFWVWPGRRQGSAMNAYGALDPGLATPLPSCALFSRKQPKKGVDNADVVIHGLAYLIGGQINAEIERAGRQSSERTPM